MKINFYMEIWKPIKEFDGKYQISNFGNIKSNNKILKPRLANGGYYRINLYYKGKYKTYNIHRFVANEFCENKYNKRCVNHKDCNTKNNNADNLEWVTHRENQMHSRKLGRYSQCDEKSSIRFKELHLNKDNRLKNYITLNE